MRQKSQTYPSRKPNVRAGWRRLPQKVRIAIRRLHRQFGHVPDKVLTNLLRSARVSKEYIDAVKYFRCIECEETAPQRTSHKTSMPNRYEFNYALGIDVLEILDADGAKYQVPTCRGCGKWTWTANICQMFRGHQEAMDLTGW